MLIDFSVKNWCSFKDEYTFSMEASKERRFTDTIYKINKSSINNVLPLAAIFGYNASGKTSLYKAFQFIQNFISKTRMPDDLIPVIPFKFSDESKILPSEFCIRFIQDGVAYRYSFSVTEKEVLTEKLEILTARSSVYIYERTRNQAKFNESFKFNNEKEKHVVQTLANIIPLNTLFLTICKIQKFSQFESIFSWFTKNLILVNPRTKFLPIPPEKQVPQPSNRENVLSGMNNLLADLDTGISFLDSDDIPVSSLNLPETVLSTIKAKLQKDVKNLKISLGYKDDIVICLRDGQLVTRRLIAVHKTKDGKNVKLHLNEESDGTYRIISLSPLLIDLLKGSDDAVIFVDEFDRSLHPLLTRRLVSLYLDSLKNNINNRKIQFIFTCHDTALLDQELMRRDEYWITMKNEFGESSVKRISDVKKGLRLDQKLRDNYLNGEFGWKPNFDKTQNTLW